MKTNTKIEISSEDLKFIEWCYSLINTARYPSFKKVTDTYNRVFGKNRKYTSCSSCIRTQVLELHEQVQKIISQTDVPAEASAAKQ